MNTVLTLLAIIVAWRLLCLRYQRAHIVLLGRHLANLQIESHMETLTQGYTRAIHEKDGDRQLQVLNSYSQTEQTVAAQVQTLATAMKKEAAETTSMGVVRICVPYIDFILPTLARDFRRLLQIHATGMRYVVDNQEHWGPKDRAYHLSAELYLLQHSCHWFCKSRSVADARLLLQHQVQVQKALDSVSGVTRRAYLDWLQGNTSV